MSPLTVATDVVIRVRDLRKTYGEIHAVDGVSFEVARGEVFGLLGPNGAGKTTTVEMLEGLRQPDGGQLEILGHRRGRPARRAQAADRGHASRPPSSTRS